MQDPSWQNSLAGQSACRIEFKKICRHKSTLTLVCPTLYAGGVWDVTIKECWVLAVGVGLAFNTDVGGLVAHGLVPAAVQPAGGALHAGPLEAPRRGGGAVRVVLARGRNCLSRLSFHPTV